VTVFSRIEYLFSFRSDRFWTSTIAIRRIFRAVFTVFDYDYHIFDYHTQALRFIWLWSSSVTWFNFTPRRFVHL